jgi:hypothetical protein
MVSFCTTKLFSEAFPCELFTFYLHQFALGATFWWHLFCFVLQTAFLHPIVSHTHVHYLTPYRSFPNIPTHPHTLTLMYNTAPNSPTCSIISYFVYSSFSQLIRLMCSSARCCGVLKPYSNKQKRGGAANDWMNDWTMIFSCVTSFFF